MLEKLKKVWNDFRLAIIAGTLAIVYFFGKKKGKDDEKAQQNKKVLENVGEANKARASLRNTDTTRKLHNKYKR